MKLNPAFRLGFCLTFNYKLFSDKISIRTMSKQTENNILWI